ncbi:hypothetical protein ACFW95_06225 [Streptomyces sp. NPDC059474]|uniref:hypothetical protein n=1 Tax=unclassified Streptomyces TaxID=2593676 RepID=UPI0033F44553
MTVIVGKLLLADRMCQLGTEFVTPDPLDIFSALGVEAEVTGETQRTLKLEDVTGEDITFSYDASGRSVRLAWCNHLGRRVVNIFREGATLLRVNEEGGRTELVTEFKTTDTMGVLRFQVFPHVEVAEESLFS